MAEVHDWTLAGVGYMLKPGSYRRGQSGGSGGTVGRVRLAGFGGGAGQATQQGSSGRAGTGRFETDHSIWRGSYVLPTLDGQGLRCGPKKQDRVETPATPVSPLDRKWSFPYNGACYVVSGSGLYKVSTSGGSYAGLTLVQALPAPVVDCCQGTTTIYFAYNSAAVIGSYDMNAGSYNATAFGSTASHYGRLIVPHAGLAAWVLPYSASNAPNKLYTGSTPTVTYTLDSAIRAGCFHDGSTWILTDRTLYRAQGATVETSLQPMGYIDDGRWMLSHLGQLYLWAGGQVVAYGKRSDTLRDGGFPAPRFDSVPVGGVGGRTSYGACSVGNWLVVSIENDRTGLLELWGYDGHGWWLLDASTGAADAYRWPVSLYGIAADADVLAGRGSTGQQTSIWQIFPRAGSAGLGSFAQVITPLWDASAPDLPKVWRRAGVELASPDVDASATFTVLLDYSTDGGKSWLNVTYADYPASGRSWSLEGTIAALPQSKTLKLKVTVYNLSTFAPAIMALWAEHETQPLPTRRREWSSVLLCRDKVVRRDGAVDATGARALAAGLWDAWDDGVSLTLRDVDYDLTGKTYTVRIADLSESVPRQSEAAGLADSEVTVRLVEV